MTQARDVSGTNVALMPLLLLLVVVAVGGCSDPAGPVTALPSAPAVSIPASPTTGSATTETTTGTTSEATTATEVDGHVRRSSVAAIKQDVLDSYLGMQETFLSAGQAGQPESAQLRSFAAGDALRLLESGLASLHAKGLRSEGDARYQPEVQQLAPARNPTTARVHDCMDTSKVHTRKLDGSTYNDTPGGNRLVIATLTLRDNTWKVTGLGVHEVGSCQES